MPKKPVEPAQTGAAVDEAPSGSDETITPADGAPGAKDEAMTAATSEAAASEPVDGPATTEPTEALAPSEPVDGPATTEPTAPPEPTEPVGPTPPSDEAGQPASDAATAEEKPQDKPRGKPRLQLDQLVVGTETRGKVVGVSKFGAFVDVGAVTDGLVHVSELSARRVRKVEDVVKSGDWVEVWIKDVDLASGRIALSMRKKPAKPMDSLKAGEVLNGTITSVTKYGVFVDIGSETEGLVHISEMSSGFVGDPKQLAQPGQPVEVRVKDVDRQRERISLSMVGLGGDSVARAAPEPVSEPTERQPTVVELALRKALGQADAGDEQAAEPGTTRKGRESGAELSNVYARMLAEYRAQKGQD